MDYLGEEGENCDFFDAVEHIEGDRVNCEYDLWTGPLNSVKERRKNFIRKMGLSRSLCVDNDEGDSDSSICDTDRRMMDNSGAVLRTSTSESTFSSGFSSDLGTLIDEFGDDESVHPSKVEDCGVVPSRMDQLKYKCLRKWRLVSGMVTSKLQEHKLRLDLDSRDQVPVQRVEARHVRKKLKELSGLFTCQNIQAHEGAILSMKFSSDGQYLASAGEDKVVRVWQVVEDERSDIIDIRDADPSCLYFSMNHLSELEPLYTEKNDSLKTRGLRKSHESACIVFPRKVFRILEKPLHHFGGHCAAVLDLSWSKNDCLLLSSSADKTVRLWKVGIEACLKSFSHTDYVTCVRFNPMNDDQFISGSIDGKVRSWTISGCQVVFWTETKDIITAVSYSPDGQGVVIGSISGTCSFFNILDNQFRLESQVCVTNKKKSPCRRITAVQFSPQDPSKVLVTCADSRIRIIDRANVITKYKGLRNAGSHLCAAFTPNGKHIISASEDSNIYFWNYEDASFPKSVGSFEFLPCDNASIAIPWPGLKCNRAKTTPWLPLHCLSLSPDYVVDSNSKISSATWPEEKLPISSPKMVAASQLGKSQYKLFKSSCQSCSSTNACGLVFVTAGCDGRVRSFHNYGLPVPL